MEKRTLLLVIIFSLLSASVAAAAPSTPPDLTSGVQAQDDLELAQRYAPVLYFHPAEIFRPQPVDVLLGTARLRQQVPYWFDINCLNEVSISDLIVYRDESYFLDIWYGSGGASDYKNYSAHRAYYQAVLSPENGGLPITAYAHVIREESETTIQYWLFYYYNDWFNKHEGDWEMVEVILDEARQPEWVVLSQHHGGTRRHWHQTQIEAGTHPAVYVALGSHANYFVGDEIYPNGQEMRGMRIEVVDRTGKAGRATPEIVLLADREEMARAAPSQAQQAWLVFSGAWGERAIQGELGGPSGPADKGDQWETPLRWGMQQPLDLDTWYQNRLRVEVAGEAVDGADIRLVDENGRPLSSAEHLGNVAILHADPSPGQVITAHIQLPLDQTYSLAAALPRRSEQQVTHYTFHPLSGSIRASLALTLPAGGIPALIDLETGARVTAAELFTSPAAWDAPDLVWVAGVLPAADVLRGVAVSLFAALFPSLLYVGVIYRADRYEKEPLSLLAVAFLWGAIPAIVAAIAAQLFFQLPPGLLGPQTFEALRAGILSPLIEETLKGAIVVWVARRYRREFDDALDGAIYGAIVGFGFAMTGNFISYLSAFLLRGYSGLSLLIFLEGIIFALNHGFYTAVFGAGLGYARLIPKSERRWLIPLGAFAAAVAANGLHNWAMRNALGFSPFLVILTFIGLFLLVSIAVGSLRRQRAILIVELHDEIPHSILQAILSPSYRRQLRRATIRGSGRAAWRRIRKSYTLSAELAFKKMQARLFPQDKSLRAEASRLRQRIKDILDMEI